MITKNQAAHLNVLIKRVVKAEIEYSEKGMHDPADRLLIIEDWGKAKTQLTRYIEKLQNK